MGTKYVVQYELDEAGWWYTSIPEVPGCHTQGRSLNQARKRVREALAAMVGEAKASRVELVDDVKLPKGASKAVREVERARIRAETAQAKSSECTRSAVRALVDDLGLSVRDAAEVLGLSFQRVQQLKAE